MKKKNKIALIVIILILIGYYLYHALPFPFNFLPVDVKELAKIKIPNSKAKIAIYYSSGNVTVEEGISVHKELGHGREERIGAYMGYNCLVSYALVGDSLSIVLSDTSRSGPSEHIFHVEIE